MTQGTTLHTVGLDLGKRFIQVHGADAKGEKLLNRRLRRDQVAPFFEALPPCCVAIETCGGGHHWGRVLAAMGHTVKLIPADALEAATARLGLEREPSPSASGQGQTSLDFE